MIVQPALDFPDHPAIGDVFAERWLWDGEKWISAAAGGGPVTVPLFSATVNGIVPKTGTAAADDVLTVAGIWKPVAATVSTDDGTY